MSAYKLWRGLLQVSLLLLLLPVTPVHTAAAAATSAVMHHPCRLCLSSFGEITVMHGARSNTVRWRNSVPLGTRGSNKLPYTLTLNNDYTVTGAAVVMLCCGHAHVDVRLQGACD
jgi:hypothetical protein